MKLFHQARPEPNLQRLFRRGAGSLFQGASGNGFGGFKGFGLGCWACGFQSYSGLGLPGIGALGLNLLECRVWCFRIADFGSGSAKAAASRHDNMVSSPDLGPTFRAPHALVHVRRPGPCVEEMNGRHEPKFSVTLDELQSYGSKPRSCTSSSLRNYKSQIP